MVLISLPFGRLRCYKRSLLRCFPGTATFARKSGVYAHVKGGLVPSRYLYVLAVKGTREKKFSPPSHKSSRASTEPLHPLLPILLTPKTHKQRLGTILF